MLDEKVHAYRSDIADIALASQLFAPHYARPLTCRVARAVSLYEAPSENVAKIADLIAGEEFALLDTSGDWSWGYRRSDHRVGYVRAEFLIRP